MQPLLYVYQTTEAMQVMVGKLNPEPQLVELLALYVDRHIQDYRKFVEQVKATFPAVQHLVIEQKFTLKEEEVRPSEPVGQYLYTQLGLCTLSMTTGAGRRSEWFIMPDPKVVRCDGFFLAFDRYTYEIVTRLCHEDDNYYKHVPLESV